MTRPILRLLPLLALALVAFFLSHGLNAQPGSEPAPSETAQALQEPPEGATYVGSDTCLSCHEAVGGEFNKTPHRDIMSESFSAPDAKDGEKVQGCESCHGPGSAHVEAGGGDVGIRNWETPMRMSPQQSRQANSTCLECHKTDNHMAAWGASVHNANTVACIACHDPHRSEHPRLLRLPSAPQPASWEPKSPPSAPRDFAAEPTLLCMECHRGQRAQAMMPSHHPMLEGKMSCSDCHDVHGPNVSSLRAINVNETCAQCHRDKTGPFAFEHAPATDNCATCHKVHGAVNDNLLAQPEPLACLKCHRSPHVGWSVNASMGQRLGRNMSYTRCSNCHQSHGSDQSQRLLY